MPRVRRRMKTFLPHDYHISDELAQKNFDAFALRMLRHRQLNRWPNISALKRVDATLAEAALTHAKNYAGAVKRLERWHAGLRKQEDGVLLALAKIGDGKAREEFVDRNQGLVHRMLRKLGYEPRGQDDLLQAGNLGLLRALEKMDLEKGIMFSTYATMAIQQAMTRHGLRHQMPLDLPNHLVEDFFTVRRAREAFHNAGVANPSASELSTATGIPMKKIVAVLAMPELPLELDAPVSDEEDAPTLGETIGVQQDFGLKEAINADTRRALHGLLATLPERNQDILRLRYGFPYKKAVGARQQRVNNIISDSGALSAEKISNVYRLTRSRVHQLINSSLKKLREHPDAEKLLE